jgi:hypothetical protein
MHADAASAQVAEPFAFTNSFVGTEEYLSPEVRAATRMLLVNLR